jgi:hypothetical protein
MVRFMFLRPLWSYAQIMEVNWSVAAFLAGVGTGRIDDFLGAYWMRDVPLRRWAADPSFPLTKSKRHHHLKRRLVAKATSARDNSGFNEAEPLA